MDIWNSLLCGIVSIKWMPVCVIWSTWLPISVSPNCLHHVSLLVKGFSTLPHYTYIYLFINYVLLKFCCFPPAHQCVVLHTPLGCMQPSLEITALYHTSHTVAWDMLVLSQLRFSWESDPCVVVGIESFFFSVSVMSAVVVYILRGLRFSGRMH